MFSGKGEVYRRLNNSCIQVNTANVQGVVVSLENGIRAFAEGFNEIAQCIITIRGCGGTSIAIVFDGRKKIFYGVLDTLYTNSDLGKIVDVVLDFLGRSTQIGCLKELKAVYTIADEAIKLRFRCRFDLDVLKAIILDAIFLAFFFANIQILQV